MEYAKLICTVWKLGNSRVITIPSKLCKYYNIKTHDKVKIMIKKHNE